MEKLTNAEVKALTNQVIKELENYQERKKKENMDKYQPSDTYLKLDALLKEYKRSNDVIEAMQKIAKESYDKIQKLSKEATNNKYWINCGDANHVLNMQKEYECTPKIPDRETIKDDIIISSIGCEQSGFAENIIRRIVNKYIKYGNK
jgi:uncharacterized protein YgiM (DUF1202 family)